MSQLKGNAAPLCGKCDRPTMVLKLDKPPGRRHPTSEMFARPKRDEQLIKQVESRTTNLVNLVCHRNDRARFEHEEWCLGGDGDVSWHQFILVRDCIYSIVRVDG